MKKTIKIPSQIRLKTEFFEGYGTEELIKTLIVLGISAFLAYILYLITRTTLISMFFVIGSVVISVVFLIKNGSGFSMVDNIKNIIKFELVQKEYRYGRGDKNIRINKKK